MRRTRHPWLTTAFVIACAALLGLGGSQSDPSLAQEKTPEAKKAKPKSADPEYPHVTLATSYQVDPAWPQRPKHCRSGATCPAWPSMPSDNVWIFTRAKPPVQVYDAGRQVLHPAGATRTSASAHHIKFDREGNVWLADIDQHVVMQFTPRRQAAADARHARPRRQATKRTSTSRPTWPSRPSGDVFVADGYGNDRIVHFDKDGKFVKAWGRAGHASRASSASRTPSPSTPRAGSTSPTATTSACRSSTRRASSLDTWSDVVTPWGFWVTKDDEIWVCGSSPMPWRPEDEALGCPPKDQVFMRFDTGGRLLQLWTVPKADDGKEKPGELNWVHAIALDSKGNIYAGDIIGKRAQKFVRQSPK